MKMLLFCLVPLATRGRFVGKFADHSGINNTPAVADHNNLQGKKDNEILEYHQKVNYIYIYIMYRLYHYENMNNYRTDILSVPREMCFFFQLLMDPPNSIMVASVDAERSSSYTPGN